MTETMQAVTSDLVFAVVTLGFLLLKVFIAWEILGVLIKLDRRRKACLEN